MKVLFCPPKTNLRPRIAHVLLTSKIYFTIYKGKALLREGGGGDLSNYVYFKIIGLIN